MSAQAKETTTATRNKKLPVIIAWMFVGLPLLWGVSQTLVKALALFK